MTNYFLDYTSVFLSFLYTFAHFISQDNLKRSVFSSLLADEEVKIKMYLNCCNKLYINVCPVAHNWDLYPVGLIQNPYS